MWVRGLKQCSEVLLIAGIRVAPYVGAWIETLVAYDRYQFPTSHPMWVRGLKQPLYVNILPLLGRTLCGCVD